MSKLAKFRRLCKYLRKIGCNQIFLTTFVATMNNFIYNPLTSLIMNNLFLSLRPTVRKPNTLDTDMEDDEIELIIESLDD